jgi:hypothetical protein
MNEWEGRSWWHCIPSANGLASMHFPAERYHLLSRFIYIFFLIFCKRTDMLITMQW